MIYVTYPPTNWDELSAWMETIYGAIFNRKVPCLHRLCLRSGFPLEDAEELSAEIEQSEAKFAGEIKHYVDEICSNGEVDFKGCSSGAAVLLHLRIKAAQTWVWSNQCGGKTVIPFPDMPFTQFAEWIFNDWWEGNGRYAAAKDEIAESVMTQAAHREFRKAGWVPPWEKHVE